MKKSRNPFKLSTISLVLGVSLSTSYVYANQDDLIEVKSFQLVGDIVSIDNQHQLKMAEALEPYQGKGKSLETLQQARDTLEKVLADLGVSYKVILPEQEIVNGNVYLQLVLKGKADSVTYKETQGYSKENIEKSLPSLKEGKFKDGRQWFDKRELNMALENPLKSTRVHYDLDPVNQRSSLSVAGYAPYGNKTSYVAVDNYGNREFSYARLSFGHMNANLTGRDDVLMINGLTNFKEPRRSYAVGVGYSLPLYAKHQNLSLSLGFSNLESEQSADGLPEGLSRRIAAGKNVGVGLGWSYYLPQLGIGVKDQLKLNLGYQFRSFSQNFSVEAGKLSVQKRSGYNLAGGNIGFSGEIKFVENGRLYFDLSQYFYSSRFPGSKNVDVQAEFADKAKSYTYTRYQLGYQHIFGQGWSIDSKLNGQYSRDNLASIERDSVTGVYNVRGFRYTGLSGDKTIVWHTEISSRRYTNANVKFYAFYDWGKAQNNTNLLEGATVSSAGVGLRAQMGRLTWDIFGARRLNNHELDRKPNGKESSRTTVWAKVTYLF